MYIIFSYKNKQYTLNKKKTLKIDFIKSKTTGDFIEINDILFLKNENIASISPDLLKTKKLKFEVIKQLKDKKIHILKFKRRKNYLKKIGHRQKYTLIKLISIE